MPSFDASRPDFAPYGLTCQRWTPQHMARCDRHNEVELNLLQRGSLTYLLGGRSAAIHAGRLTAFWAGAPHQITACEGDAPYYVITLPLAWFLQIGLPAPIIDRLLHGDMIAEPTADRQAADWQAMEDWERDLSRGGDAYRDLVLAEVAVRLRRLALHQPAPVKRTPRRGRQLTDAPTLAEAMARHIAQHSHELLTIRDVARAVDRHPHHAMTVFRATFGTTIQRFLTEHRLMHAQRMLATSDDRILDIALAAGFGSISRFNTVFAAACGCTPREWRQRHR